MFFNWYSSSAVEEKATNEETPEPLAPSEKQEGEKNVMALQPSQREPLKPTRIIYLWAACAAMNSCNLGYNIGVNTVISPLVQNYFDLSKVELEIFLGCMNFLAMAGALMVTTITDRFGRKMAFSASSIVFLIGISMETFAQNFATLMIGRVFVGLAVGFAMALDPMYIAEIAPPESRGQLVSWAEIALTSGIALGFTSGLVFYDSNPDIAWRYEFGVGLTLPILMLYFANCVLAESPRWLVARGQHQKAKHVLKRIYGEDANVTPILDEIEEAVEREQHAGSDGGWSLVLNPPPSFARMIWVGVAVAVSQELNGIEGIQYFLLYILEEGGVTNTLTQMKIVVALGLMRVISTTIGGKLFDIYGRRPLFFISLTGTGISLFVLAINFWTADNGVLSIVCLTAYLFMYDLGLGPGAWMVPTEIFVSSIRVKAISLSTFFNRLAAALYACTFLTVADAITWGGYMLLMSVLSLIVIAFLYKYLPETKGKTIEQFAVYFAEITGDRSILDYEEKLARRTQERKKLKESEQLA